MIARYIDKYIDRYNLYFRPHQILTNYYNNCFSWASSLEIHNVVLITKVVPLEEFSI